MTSCSSPDTDLPGLSTNALSIDDSAPYIFSGGGIDLGGRRSHRRPERTVLASRKLAFNAPRRTH